MVGEIEWQRNLGGGGGGDEDHERFWQLERGWGWEGGLLKTLARS